MTSGAAGAASGGAGGGSGFSATGGLKNPLETSGFSAHVVTPISPTGAAERSVAISGNPVGSSSGASTPSPVGEATLECASRIDELVKGSVFGTSYKGGDFWKVEKRSLDAKKPMTDLLEEIVNKVCDPQDTITGYSLDLKLETMRLHYKDENGVPKIKIVDLKVLAKEDGSKISENFEAVKKDAKVKMKDQGIEFDSFALGTRSGIYVGKTASFDARVQEKKYNAFISDVNGLLNKVLAKTRTGSGQAATASNSIDAAKGRIKKIREDILKKVREKKDVCEQLLSAIGSATGAQSTPTDEEALRKQMADLQKMEEVLLFEDPLNRGDALRGQDVDLACALAFAIGESDEYREASFAKREEIKKEIAEGLRDIIMDYKVKGIFNFMKNKLSNLNSLLNRFRGIDTPQENPKGHDEMKKAAKQFGSDVAGLLYHFDGDDSQTVVPKRERYQRLCEKMESNPASEGVAEALFEAVKVGKRDEDMSKSSGAAGAASGVQDEAAAAAAKEKAKQTEEFNAFASFLGLTIRE